MDFDTSHFPRYKIRFCAKNIIGKTQLLSLIKQNQLKSLQMRCKVLFTPYMANGTSH